MAKPAVDENPKLSVYALFAASIGLCLKCYHHVSYCATWSIVWDRDYNAARNILYCFLYELASAARPRPFKCGIKTESD
ncbi:hypothetical protein SeLEV6574_g03251 [Synchytrium endobioticum]|uniref:Uncharacterized protein n=1 Tax=Synchytrium endobioticum TaxID=286115 RepID=A0A507D565_9FUNG|nr:hypothetical protein SeLEV6574_g03251 [Synchytrium endobioticum]